MDDKETEKYFFKNAEVLLKNIFSVQAFPFTFPTIYDTLCVDCGILLLLYIIIHNIEKGIFFYESYRIYYYDK